MIKDTAFLKKGVEIYLGHLIPFFSRISKYPPRDYPGLKESLLEDVHGRIREHFDQLEGLYARIREETPSQSDIARFIDLEELRAMVESEIYIGAVALGSIIFNFIYWGFGFLRMGTTGLTAQAYGGEDCREASLILEGR